MFKHSARLAIYGALLSLISGTALASGPISTKRGLAYSGIQPEDLALMSGNIAWWYNWSTVPESSAGDDISQYSVEYVPMAYGADFDETALRAYLDNHPEVKYLLAYNEPNFTDQADLTPEQAAAAWPTLESIADDYHLKLVGPAMNYSPGNVAVPNTDNDGCPYEYLNAFFDACSNCRVDYIAVHSYMSTPAAFEAYVKAFYERYHRPIWVTEWNLSKDDDSETVEQQMDYMGKTVRWMEQQDYVFRYAWFIGRTSGGASASPYVDILGDTGKWTALGSVYQGIPGKGYYTSLPATIQAEHAYTMTGMHHRATTDSNGDPVVQLFSDQDDSDQNMTFQVQSDSDTTYTMLINYATAANAQISIQVDGGSAQSLLLPNTGGIYLWQTQTTSLSLTSGQHTISISVDNGYPGFDWIQLQ